MSIALFLAGTGTAAVARHLVGRTLCAWQALLVVNTAGSVLLGYVIQRGPGSMWELVIGTGFCGTLTTYSSFALEVRALGWRGGSLFAAVAIGCAAGGASIGVSLASG